MAIDLPIQDVKLYVDELLEQIGEECTVDGVPAKIMRSYLSVAVNNIHLDNLQDNTCQVVMSHDVIVNRGSRVVISGTGQVGVVYKHPNDDLVSKSLKLLLCNSMLDVLDETELYNEDTGDLISNDLTPTGFVDGFIERISARERLFDVGLLSDTVVRFTTFAGANIGLEDKVRYRDKLFKVIDVNDMDEGLLILQLSTLRV